MCKRRENRSHTEFKKAKQKPFPTTSQSGNMALINGKWVKYSCIDTRSKEVVIDYYGDKFKYLGATRTLSHNGRISKETEICHCFLSKTESKGKGFSC